MAGRGEESTAWTVLLGAVLTAALLALLPPGSRDDGRARARLRPQGEGAQRRPFRPAGRRAAADDPGLAYPDDGHGRTAVAPSEIPPAGWRDVLLRVWREIQEDRLLAEAAAITFYTLLAIFPGLAALVSLYGLFADPATVTGTVAWLRWVVPGGGIELIEEQLRRVAAQGQQKLGIGFLAGLAISLWSANQAVKALFDALNVVYGEREKRSFLRFNLLAFAFTLGALVFLLLALAGVVVVPVALQVLGLEELARSWLPLLRWPILLMVVAIFLAVVYRYGPSRERARWHWVSWGGMVAAVGWIGISVAFSWYVANFGSYNATYGSLGAVVGFMTWIWISAAVVLIGAEFNAELEHQTARDSTTGPALPLGERGARMADRVAPPEP